jgi:hypothetical protein
MGDHRADIKIKFSMYGETETADMWINWSVGSGECYEVDQRVIDFFRDAYLKMRNKYDDQAFKLEESQQKPHQWQGLTDEEIKSVCHKRDWTATWTDTTFARAIEAKLREKNA